jgi:hypothetical protein
MTNKQMKKCSTILSHKTEANQNNTEISPHPSQIGYHPAGKTVGKNKPLFTVDGNGT